MSDPEISHWWEHWSVSGSVFIAALSFGRDYYRDIGTVQNNVIWYVFESLFLFAVVVLMAVKVKENIFKDVQMTNENDACLVDSTVSMKIQTKHRDYVESTEKLKAHFHVKIAEVNKEIRQLRKHFSSKIKQIKTSTKDVSSTMSNIQLKVPALTQENRFLLEENDVIQAQLLQELEKQQDLNEKFQELHSYIQNQGRIAMTEPVVDFVQ